MADARHGGSRGFSGGTYEGGEPLSRGHGFRGPAAHVSPSPEEIARRQADRAAELVRADRIRQATRNAVARVRSSHEEPAAYSAAAEHGLYSRHAAAGDYGEREHDEGYGEGYGAGEPAPPTPSRRQKLIHLFGAACSIGLVIGLGWWGWQLAIRDARGVPVVRALEGPMRIAPEDPGGQVISHQGLAVNEVAASGGATPPAERLVLAPPPLDLTGEDAPGLTRELPPAAAMTPEDAVAGEPELELAEESPKPQEITESLAADIEAQGTESAIALALAEALEAGDMTDPFLSAVEDGGEPARALPEGAIARSPRPPPRPAGLARAAAAMQAAAPAAAKPVKSRRVDPSTLAPGTKLVQFGAFDSEETAESEWVRLSQRFPDLLADKDMVIQSAESGGRTFWRLRALGFANESEARRFCAVFDADGMKCIPVNHR